MLVKGIAYGMVTVQLVPHQCRMIARALREMDLPEDDEGEVDALASVFDVSAVLCDVQSDTVMGVVPAVEIGEDVVAGLKPV